LTCTGLEAHFLDSAGGKIFVVAHRPAAAPRATVMFVPAFAEEMNKSRRMITLAAQELTRQNWSCIVPDLYGTGDSEGEFAEASWDIWLRNLQDVLDWCAARGEPVRALVAVRLGAALACDLSHARPDEFAATVFWQPLFDGARTLEQFLRLRVAASLLEEDRKESVAGLQQQLKGGAAVDVAGYVVSPRLAAQLNAVRCEAVHRALGRVHWLEVVRSAESPISPAAQRMIEQSRSTGTTIATRAILGQPFWGATEIVTLPQVVAATADALREPAS
jgi:exosortase A-associated hydrolase 2